ncbi:hypothetical protein LB518_11580 [Mesorhizobium sp. BR1-1-16]|uniref:hypothetical protein n=1 Tax=Mesorhizobium sp. BR1-1-16 TaxID=2876653 RepID=UPI001CCDDD38|nr:hypothetical protein [Mesorhizobium sp. BR1-1-16]MBZ9936938.1 hypothetical protein [Mesorhizobium sp. BR1-1-16]
MTGFETIGGAFQAGCVARVRCNGKRKNVPKSSRPCEFRADLDMQTLLLTRGPNFPLEMLPSRLMCPSCGGRNM